ncbi:MAG TPA: chromosomal replication initiator protein DnaA [Ktedonobacterales bacterium]|nr:chromosomal replication initiator protein DnaA [Ktedonobacterales bacterium]
MGRNQSGSGASMGSTDARHIWQKALERIAQRVSAGAYSTWFRGTSALELTEDTLVVGVGNTFACEHLRQRFLDVARAAVSEALGRAAEVAFVLRDHRATAAPAEPETPALPPASPPTRHPTRSRAWTARQSAAVTRARSRPPEGHEPAATQAALPLAQSSAQPTMQSAATHPVAQPEPAHARHAMHPTPLPAPEASGAHELNPRYVFETFVVGLTNQLAYAAARQVATNPGESYNPLLIYGGVGLGKTHLLHAIGHSARARGLSVAYVTAERFTNEIIGAIRTRATELFRARYRAVDVLLVDDVQFIAGKESTEEEFFHTFNTLHESNKQIVLTSDCVPAAMRHLHDRLRSRFAWGLIADIQPPDYEHRLNILRAKASLLRLDIPEEALAALAALRCESIRELEGALTRVTAYAQMLGQPIEGEMVRLALAPIAGAPASGPERPAADTVLAMVARHFALTIDDLRGKSRNHQIAWARQVAMYLLREETDASLFVIGRQLGGRDHTTIMHGCARVAKAIAEDREARREVEDVRASLHH